MSWIPAVLFGVLKFLAGLFTTKEPVKEIIERPEPEIPTDDGKTDKERLSDLGL